jgi:PAS domain S-box-containing protein
MSKQASSPVRMPIEIAAICLAVVAMLWAALIFDVHRSQDQAVTQAGADAANLAMAFRENVKRTIDAIDQLMRTIIAANNESADPYHIPAWVQDSPLLKGMSVQVSISGPDGIMRASSLGSVGRVDISDRPHFKYHLDPAAPQPYISVPVIGRNSGKWSIQVTRRITAKDGSFSGIVVVSVDPFYFSQFFESVQLGERGVVDLVGRDGIVRARRARDSQVIGQDVGGTALFKQMQASDSGSEIIRSKLDGVTRVYGYSAVSDYPLVVAVGIALDDVLAPVNRQLHLYLIVGGILSLMIATLCWLLAREVARRRQRELASLAEEKISEQKLLLDTALNNMRDGLLMFDKDGRAVVVNQSYVEMYQLSPEAAKPGCTLRELLQLRKANGTFGGDIDNVNFRLVDKVFDIPDGRSIRVSNKFMDNGGWVSVHEDVTQKRKAEAALQQALAEAEKAGKETSAAHTRLREAFDVVPEALALFDADDRYVIWNQRCAELYERTPNAIQVGKRFEDVLRDGLAAGQYPEAQGREGEWLARRMALHAQDSSSHEQELSGGRWLRICERRTADGGSVGIRIDISELKQREESVRMLFDFNPVPMFVFDCDDLKFLAVNDMAVRQYGYSREQFLAMTELDAHPPEDRHAYIKMFDAFRDSGRTEFEPEIGRRHRKADGSDMLVHVFGRRLTYNGRSALLCSMIDVTERVRAEQERDRNREFLNSIIDNVSVTLHVKDARSLRYVLVNKAAEKLWGLSRDAMIGKTPHEIFDKQVADIIEDHDRQLLTATSNFYVPAHEMETPNNGLRVVTSNRIAIRDQKGEVQYLVGVVEDVTDRKAVEDQLRQAQKMEAIGNLTGGVAHDFNNLLTVIMGNLDLLQEDVADNAGAREKINVILDAAERGAELTRHMLAFSRRQPLQAKAVDVNTLIAATMRLLSRTLGENITVDVQPSADPATAMVDPSQLETALLNIAINARDAMPNGGKLTIRARLAALDEAYVARHPDVASGRYVAIEITDTGIGMPAAVLERIFEPFFTTKAHGQGTGLGLSMVYGFIKQSGGHISAYSEVGRGTVFKLFLPMADAAAAASERGAAVPRPPKPGGNEVILAVEDNADIRATVVRQLRDLGYCVHEADSADAALRILDAAEPIDLLFTDIIMPGKLNGKELANKARATRADLKVLFTSGYPGTSNAHGAQLEPGDVLLSKPYHKHDLAKAVEQVLNAPD